MTDRTDIIVRPDHKVQNSRVSQPPMYAVVDGIWQFDIDSMDFTIAEEGTSIASLAPETDQPLLCIVNGLFISRKQWDLPILNGDIMVFLVSPRGGGGKGSNIMATVLQLALVVAVSAMTSGMAAGFATSLIRFGAMALGTLLIQAILPTPKAAGPAAEGETSPTYSFGLQGNYPRLDQSIPVVYGIQLVYPDYASQPYTYFDAAGDEYFCAVLCVGKGYFEFKQLRIDDTDIKFFDSVRYDIIGPGQTNTSLAAQNPFIAVPHMVVATEVAGQDIVKTSYIGPYNVVRPGFTVDAIYVDMVFPRGIGNVSDTGAVTQLQILWEIVAQKVSDQDQPIGPWLILGTEGLIGNNPNPYRKTYSYFVEPGRYLVRMRRLSIKSDNSRVLDDITWAALRGRLVDPGTLDPTCTYVVVEIKATEQMSNVSQRQFNCIVQRLLPEWTGLGWTVPVPTRSPAWALADVWRNSDYGRGLSNERMDLATLLALDAVWTQRQDNFDFIFDTKTTVWEASQKIARVGRAVPLLRNGKYTAVRDHAQDLPVAMFNMRNIRQGSFTMSFITPTEDTPDAVDIEFMDGRTWTLGRVRAQAVMINGEVLLATYDPSNSAEEVTAVAFNFQGVIGRSHATREAITMLADSIYRRRRIALSTEMEALIPAFGSLVAISHDLPSWGQSGDIVYVESEALGTSEPLAWKLGVNHYVRLRSAQGDVSAPILVTKGTGDSEMILSTLAPFQIWANVGDMERTKYIFGPAGDYGELCIVKSIRPRSQDEIELDLVVEDARVHTVDNSMLPTSSAVQDPPYDGSLVNIAESGQDEAYIANLVSFHFPGGASVGTTIVVRLIFQNDGRFAFNSELVGYNSILVYSGDSTLVGGKPLPKNMWMLPQPVTTTISGNYSIRFTQRSLGDPSINTAGSDAFGTWMLLNQTRRIVNSVQAVSNGYYPSSYLVEIKNNTSGVIEASATFYIDLSTQGTPEGGA